MPTSTKSAYNDYSPEIYSVIREVLHTIGDIDYQHEAEIHKAEKSSAGEEIKNYIKQKIRAAHQSKRQPYIDLLNTLRSRLQR
jgi:hypothetical protein